MSHLLDAPVIFFESSVYHRAERLLEDHHGIRTRLNKSRKKALVIIKAVGTILRSRGNKKKKKEKTIYLGMGPVIDPRQWLCYFFCFTSLSNYPVQEHIPHPPFEMSTSYRILYLQNLQSTKSLTNDNADVRSTSPRHGLTVNLSVMQIKINVLTPHLHLELKCEPYPDKLSREEMIRSCLCV